MDSPVRQLSVLRAASLPQWSGPCILRHQVIILCWTSCENRRGVGLLGLLVWFTHTAVVLQILKTTSLVHYVFYILGFAGHNACNLTLFSLIPAWVWSEEVCLVPRPLFIFSRFWNADGSRGLISAFQFAGHSVCHTVWELHATQETAWCYFVVWFFKGYQSILSLEVQLYSIHRPKETSLARLRWILRISLLPTAWVSTVLSLMWAERHCLFQSWGWKWQKEPSISLHWQW